jgi:basic membrane protein A
MRVSRKGWSAIAALCVVTVAAAGAAQAGRTAKSGKVTTLGIATPATTNDYGWNAQGVLAARATASKFHLKLDSITNIGYDKTDVTLRQLAHEGANLIVAHASGYDTIATRMAQQLKVPILTYDNPTGNVKGLVASITTKAEQPSYLAGVLAAKTTKTGKIGIVVSASAAEWWFMSGGFVAGARSVNPHVKIEFGQIGPASFDDAAGGKRVVTSLIGTGADVIFGMGDDASFGYLQAIENAKVNHKVWYIGDIGNMTPIDKKHVLLSSVMWSFTSAFNKAVRDVNAGTFGTHGYTLNVNNGGVYLLKTKYIPAATWTQIATDQRGIASGKIRVPVTGTANSFHRLLKG